MKTGGSFQNVVDVVYEALISSKFCRDRPSKPGEIIDNIEYCLKENIALKILLLWGGSKEKTKIYTREEESLEHLTNYKNFIERFGIKINLELLFCGLHHIAVNKVPREES